MELQLIDFGYPLHIDNFDFDENQFELFFWNMENTKRYYYRFKNGNNVPLIVGITTYGKVAIWEKKRNRIKLIDWSDAEIKQVKNEAVNSSQTFDIQKYINNLMKQYVYRYQLIPEQYNSRINNNFIEEILYDGTLDKVHDGRLFNYHITGVPHRLHISLSSRFQDLQLYFWFNIEISNFFSRFYGAHPETKTDFIIRIDAENKKYELALYRQGLKEPVVIPESAYQLIVFKNKFEDYRSENYNQPRGAWIW